MAKSKAPRKAYRRGRWNPLALMIPQDDVKAIKDQFRRVEFLVELKLGFGTMSADDVQCLREFINFGTVIVYAGKAIDREKFAALYLDDLKALQDAFQSYYQRFLDKHTVTATGDELKAIKNGVEICGAVIQDELEREMFWCIKCFVWMRSKTQIERGKAGRTRLDFDGAEKEIGKITLKEVREKCRKTK